MSKVIKLKQRSRESRLLRGQRNLVFRTLRLVLLALVLLLLQTSITAASLVENPLAPPDTSSPQATMRSFLDNTSKYKLFMEVIDKYLKDPGLLPSTSIRQQAKDLKIFLNRAEDCLNLSEIPLRLKRDKGIEAIIMLKEVLDRIEIPPYAEIPDFEAVASDEELTRWRLPRTRIEIVKVESGSRVGEFLFSAETVARSEEFYQNVKKLPYKPGATEGFYELYVSSPGRADFLLPFKLLQGLPSWLKAVYWGQSLWQWIGLGISLPIAFWIPYKSFSWNQRRITTLKLPQRTWSKLLSPLIAIVSLEGFRYFIDQWLNITGKLFLIGLTTLEIIFWILISLTILFLSNALAETIVASPRVKSRSLDASGIRTFFILLGLVIGTVTAILGIESVGISIIPILAGLGFGGLALALAARPSLENIIAGLLLFADRPVQVGEYCRFGGQEGTVLNIGLRSTRIFALNGDIISLPNSNFSELELVNKSRRTRILLRQIIGLRYETTSEQLRYVLVKLRSMLLAHPKLIKESVRVRFIKYGDYSKDVEIFAYVRTGDWIKFLEIQEDLLLGVEDIIERAGTGFAFPSQTTYISRDQGLDRDLSRAAEAEVQAWRSKGELPFREFPPNTNSL